MLPNFARSVTVTFTGDSAITQIQRDTLVTRRVAAREAFPEFDDVVSLYALPIAALIKTNRDSANFRSYPPGTSQSNAMLVVRNGPNRYWLYSEGNPIKVLTDDRGRVLSVDGSRTTYRRPRIPRALTGSPAIPAGRALHDRHRADGRKRRSDSAALGYHAIVGIVHCQLSTLIRGIIGDR